MSTATNKVQEGIPKDDKVNYEQRNDNEFLLRGELARYEVHNLDERRIVVVIPADLFVFLQNRSMLDLGHYNFYFTITIILNADAS